MSDTLRVLFIAEQCNPEWTSVPLEAFSLCQALSRRAAVTLVTHEWSRGAITRVLKDVEIAGVPESRSVGRYYGVIERLTRRRGHVNWPFLHVLSYPAYAEFNRRVYSRFRDEVLGGRFDIVHAFTPIPPRYPVKMIRACRRTPFILGPVNGGLSYPGSFRDIERKEHARLRFLRFFCRLLPDYRRTYERADKILAGSPTTFQMLQDAFGGHGDRIQMFAENGVTLHRYHQRRPGSSRAPLRLLFVGRLVPYKCVDVVLQAMGRLDDEARRQVELTIVGDGPERQNLEGLARALGVTGQVRFVGWVNHQDLPAVYGQSDVFCFPSIREFGGAVVLEAMAAGLPCIVADYGGIGYYVAEDSGFKIAPVSKAYLSEQMAAHILTLVRDPELFDRMSSRAIERARAFDWDHKADQLIEIYAALIARKRTVSRQNVGGLSSTLATSAH